MSITREQYTAIYKGFNNLEKAIEIAADKYNTARKKAGLPCLDDDLWWSGDVTELEASGATIHWETTWGYGGRDSGTCFIPAEALCIETQEQYIEQKVADDKKIYLAKQRKERADERKAKREEIKRLQAELEADQ